MMKRILIVAAAAAAFPLATGASPYTPVEGSPNSIQQEILQVGLDLGDFDEGPPAETDDSPGGVIPDGDANTIGVAATRWEGMGIDGGRFEARYQRAWRPFEGSRSRGLVDVPINMITVDGETATSAAISLGLEVPVTANWSLTPRASAAKTWAGTYFGGDGELLAASVTSRLRLAQVGRGDLVIGNLVGYTAASSTFGDTNHWAFRNGVAYQFPLKSLVFGRQASARLSYTQTNLTGDAAFIDQSGEIAANLGVRMREDGLRNQFELLRFGLLYTFAEDFSATTVTVGYRF